MIFNLKFGRIWATYHIMHQLCRQTIPQFLGFTVVSGHIMHKITFSLSAQYLFNHDKKDLGLRLRSLDRLP